jgi:hypothetical protein
VSDTQEWRGCQLSAPFSDYWHAARDFASYALCGARTGTMTEQTSPHQEMCPACRQAYADHAWGQR